MSDATNSVIPFERASVARGALPGQPRVGLVAGWGRYPIIVAETLREQGYWVSCLGVMHHADPSLAQLCPDFTWIGLAKLGRAIRHFQSRGIQQATMAGKFHKTLLYQPWLWLRHLPDWRGLRTFYPYLRGRKQDCKDDTLLGVLVDAFAAEGIEFRPATDYVPNILVQQGQIAGRAASAHQTSDIEFGWWLAKDMGRLDVGQSVCVKNRAVLAVEAIEGTDACIRRAGELCESGEFTVVKVAKPQQDMRFDVPTIGLGTLQTMVDSGARTLAVEASRTIILDAARFTDFAEAHQLRVVALADLERAAVA